MVFEIIELKIVKGEIDLYLWLFLILFDCFYECKNFMVVFLYWWLKCGDEWFNFFWLRILWNRLKNIIEEEGEVLRIGFEEWLF